MHVHLQPTVLSNILFAFFINSFIHLLLLLLLFAIISDQVQIGRVKEHTDENADQIGLKRTRRWRWSRSRRRGSERERWNRCVGN